MRVLLTGHNGYIGAVMVPLLRAGGHEVVGLDTCLFEGCAFGEAERPTAELRMDLRDVAAADLDGFDAVVHLGALSNDPLGSLAPEQTYAVNHAASIRLAELAKAAGVGRFLYASSCSIYGAAGGGKALDETATMQPVTPYARSKVLVEDGLRELADARFSPTYLRNATAYGYSPQLRTDLVLNDLVAGAYLSGEVRVLSDGTPWRPLVHVEDIARAFLAALEAPREVVHDEAFNVGGDSENYQVRDLANIVAQQVPGSRVVITGETGGDPRSYRVDFTKVAAALDFRPVWTASMGARQLYEAYRRRRLTPGDATWRFKRLPWLASLQESGRVGSDLRWQPQDAQHRSGSAAGEPRRTA